MKSRSDHLLPPTLHLSRLRSLPTVTQHRTPAERWAAEWEADRSKQPGFQAEEFFCENLGLSCGVGEIKIARLFCEDTAIIETGTGNILLDQYQGPSLDINSGVGETTITVAGDETDYNYTLNASLGEIYLNHHHFSKSHDSDFAACLEKDYNADQDIQIQNALGNINLTFMEESL